METLSFSPNYGEWYADVNINYEVVYNATTNKTTVTFSQSSASYSGRDGYGTRMDCTITVKALDSDDTKSVTLTTYGYTHSYGDSFTGTPSPSSIEISHIGEGTKTVKITASCTINAYLWSGSTSQTAVVGSRSIDKEVGGRYTLSITQGVGSTITVKNRLGTQLSDGAILSLGSQLYIMFSIDTPYILNTHTVNGVEYEGSQYSTYTVEGDVSVVTTTSVKSYSLILQQGNNTLISVNRTSSPYGGGAEGYIDSNTALYYGDRIAISYTVFTGYTIDTHTVNDTEFVSNTSYVISSSITVITTATLNTYSITSIIGDHIGLVIQRISSPLGGGSIGIISNNSTVYHGDELTITATPNSGYGIESLSVNGSSVTSPYTITVVSFITIIVIATALGFVHIDSGSAIEKYKILIDSGSAMEQYRAMIDTGSEIVPY